MLSEYEKKDFFDAIIANNFMKIQGYLNANKEYANCFYKLTDTSVPISPMHLAVSIKNKDIILLLKNFWGNINIQDEAGFTPSHYLAFVEDKNFEKEYIEFLSKVGADFNIADKSGKTLLHYLVTHDADTNVVLCRNLILNGANPNIEFMDNEGNIWPSILHYYSKTSIVNLIASTYQEKGLDFKICDIEGNNALFYALENKKYSEENFETLYQACPDLDKSKMNFNNIFHFIAKFSSPCFNALKILSSIRNAEILINLENKDGKTPFDLAKENSNEIIKEYFINFNKNISSYPLKSLLTLGEYYYASEFTNPNNKKSFSYYQEAYNKGSFEGAFYMAMIYLDENSNLEEARKLFQKVIDSKEPQSLRYQASKLLGIMYLFGKGGPKQYRDAKKLFDNITLNGNTDYNIDYYLAYMHHYGYGTDKNLNAAEQYYEKSIKKGDNNSDKAKKELELLYKEQFELLLSRYNDKGDISAANDLGSLYREGKKVPKDTSKAIEYLEYASKNGNKNASLTLGKMYSSGELKDKESALRKALEYYELALPLNEVKSDINIIIKNLSSLLNTPEAPYALIILSNIYRKGIGIKKDLLEAKKFLIDAKDKGSEEAEIILKEVDSKLLENKETCLNSLETLNAKELFKLGNECYYHRNKDFEINRLLTKSIFEKLIEKAEIESDHSLIESAKRYIKSIINEWLKTDFSNRNLPEYPETLNQLGLEYMEGKYIDKNLTAAKEKFEEALNFDFKKAAGNLDNVKTLIAINTDYYSKKTISDDPNELFDAGKAFYEGTLVQKNYLLSKDCLQQAKELGLEKATKFLADIENTANFKKRELLYNLSKPRPDIELLIKLGGCYLYGIEFPKNLIKAQEVFAKSLSVLSDYSANEEQKLKFQERINTNIQKAKLAIEGNLIKYSEFLTSNNSEELFEAGETFFKGELVDQDLQKAKEAFEEIRRLNNSHIEEAQKYIDNINNIYIETLKSKTDDILACNELAKIYYKGITVPKDLTLAKYFYNLSLEISPNAEAEKGLTQIQKEIEFFIQDLEEKAANGDKDTLNELGLIYQKGDLVKQDYVIARKWLHSGVQAGSTEAKDNLTKLNNLEISSLRQKAGTNDPEAQNQLGLKYFEGVIVGKNFVEAEKYFKAAIQLHYPEASFNLGHLYEAQKNYSGAKKYFIEAHNRGYPNAIEAYHRASKLLKEANRAKKSSNFGLEIEVEKTTATTNLLYKSNSNFEDSEITDSSPIDSNAAAETSPTQTREEIKSLINDLEKRALNLDKDALNELGLFYQKGELVKQNYETARDWFHCALQAGSREARDNLIKLDKQEISSLIKKAENNDPKAQNQLGLKYFEGTILRKNFAEAEKYFKAATELNYPEAFFNLGRLYEAQENYPGAKKYYIAAHKKGHANAMEAFDRVSELLKEVNRAKKSVKYAQSKEVTSEPMEIEETITTTTNSSHHSSREHENFGIVPEVSAQADEGNNTNIALIEKFRTLSENLYDTLELEFADNYTRVSLNNSKSETIEHIRAAQAEILNRDLIEREYDGFILDEKDKIYIHPTKNFTEKFYEFKERLESTISKNYREYVFLRIKEEALLKSNSSQKNLINIEAITDYFYTHIAERYKNAVNIINKSNPNVHHFTLLGIHKLIERLIYSDKKRPFENDTTEKETKSEQLRKRLKSDIKKLIENKAGSSDVPFMPETKTYKTYTKLSTHTPVPEVLQAAGIVNYQAIIDSKTSARDQLLEERSDSRALLTKSQLNTASTPSTQNTLEAPLSYSERILLEKHKNIIVKNIFEKFKEEKSNKVSNFDKLSVNLDYESLGYDKNLPRLLQNVAGNYVPTFTEVKNILVSILNTEGLDWTAIDCSDGSVFIRMDAKSYDCLSAYMDKINSQNVGI
ncbi:MAG: hypothetical protein ACK4OM_00955 [Alphaproteobacteria bacterium]